MSARMYVDKLINDKDDFLPGFIDFLNNKIKDYCIIGDFGINAYSEPIITLYLDVVVKPKHNAMVRTYLKINKTYLKIEVWTDAKRRKLIAKSEFKNVLDYKIKVAPLEDLFEEKIWCYLEMEEKLDTKMKNMSDFIRLLRIEPKFKANVPKDIRKALGIIGF